jgi:site-specific DNA recombinase
MTAYMPPPSTLHPGAIVWDYLRDSGGSSQELSVPQQDQEVENFCNQYGFVRVRSFCDIARSGTSVVGRDSFLEMIENILDPKMRPQAILVWNYSRIARDLTDASYYKGLIRRYGIQIHSLTDPVTEGEYRPLVEMMIDFSNQEKSRQTSRDVKRALHSMVNQGFSSGGTPPRCYLAEKVEVGVKRDGSPRIVSRWVPDPELWELGQLAWKLRAQGKSYGEIQEATGGRIYKSKGSWNTFFANESYLGIGKCGDERIPDHHPALVDQQTWDSVQALRQSHPKYGSGDLSQHPRRVAAPSMLAGMLFCAHCGSAMSHQTYKNSSWRCYICGKKSREGWKSCPGKMVNARNAEIVVLNAVLNRILTPECFSDLLHKVQERFADNADLEREIRSTRLVLSKVERAVSNLLDALENQGVASVAERLKEREAEKSALQSKLQALVNQQAASALKISKEAIELVLSDWRDRLLRDLQIQDIQAVRDILHQLIARIEVSYDHIRIYYRYSLSDGEPTIEGDFVDQNFTELHDACIQSVFEIAPHLASPTKKDKPPKPIKPRDAEIYRLHTEENRTITSLAGQFGLAEKTIWGICTRVRKRMMLLLPQI